MAASTRLLVLGLDAASGVLVREWASAGHLPHFAALMARGRTVPLKGVEGFFTGATWPSFLTGTSPARHGIHYLAQLRPGSYAFERPHEGAYIRAPMFWEPLVRAGRRLAILDLPLAPPDSAVNGIQTVEWAGHDAIFGFRTTPPSLAGEILARHGAHPVPSDCDRVGRSPEEFRRFVATLVQGVEAKARLTADLLRREPWDLFFQVFTETHCVGHQCWHLHDPSHPNHDPAVFGADGDPVRQVYQAVDRALGELLAAAGDVPVMVVLPHGMAHTIGVHRVLPMVLERLGLASPPPARPHRRTLKDYARGVARRLPQPVSVRALEWLDPPPAPGQFGLPVLGADPAASRCFVVPNGLAVSGIRLNLVGREPAGRVQPGDEADRLLAELREALLALREERSGTPLVTRVMATGDLYQGPERDRLPDILVEWNEALVVGSAVLDVGPGSVIRATSARTGTVEAVNNYMRTGEHRPRGLLIAAGPGIAPGRETEPVSLLDVAPTLTAALGVPLDSAEGRPLPAFIPSP